MPRQQQLQPHLRCLPELSSLLLAANHQSSSPFRWSGLCRLQLRHLPQHRRAGTRLFSTTAPRAFLLTNGHANVPCASCHLNNNYNLQIAPTDCGNSGCHLTKWQQTTNPVHSTSGPGFAPANCANCHTTKGWDAASFDHAVTGFALVGTHKSPTPTPCAACHVNNNYSLNSADCMTCHTSRLEQDANPRRQCSQSRHRGIPLHHFRLCHLPHHHHLGRWKIRSQYHRLSSHRRPRQRAVRYLPHQRQLHFENCSHRLRQFRVPPHQLAADHQSGSLHFRSCLRCFELRQLPHHPRVGTLLPSITALPDSL